MPWNEGLDRESSAYRIAADENRFIRVVAGPGTGKSFALKRRVARLLEGGTAPDRILAVTFTNVAAEDLHRELRGMDVEGCDELRGSTLHSLSMRILARQNVLEATGRIARPLNRFEMEPLLYDLSSEYGDKRGRAKRIRAYEAAWARLQHEAPGYAITELDRSFERSLVSWLTFHQGMLIGEIIPQVYQYLSLNPAAPEKQLFDHILVDEYQDLNRVEQAVIDLLTENSHLCVVGDDDQSLYSFKFAHPEGIRTFEITHDPTTDHSLAECRRCGTRVVTIANSLIAHNTDREPRSLDPFAANGEGEVITVQFETLEDEARGIAAFIQRRIARGNQPQDFLILAQRRSIGNPIHAALNDLNIPSKSYYEEGLLDNEVAQERIAILKLFLNRDDRIALRWLLGFGSNNFRAGSYARLRTYCENNNVTPWDALESISRGELRVAHAGPLVAPFNLIRTQLVSLIGDETVADFVLRWLPPERTGIDEFRLVVDECAATSETVEDLFGALIEKISLPDIPPDVEEVRIMSLHKSKGLSSPIVIIAGCVEGVLPSAPDRDLSLVEQNARLQEERRLFYVGVTRKKSSGAENPGTLVMTYSREMSLAAAMQSGIQPARTHYDRAFMNASRFIRDLGPQAGTPITGTAFDLIE